MPHSYGSSFTLLYLLGWIRLVKTSVNTAKPVATATKMAIGMYDESMGNDRARQSAAQPWKSGWFITCDLGGVKKPDRTASAVGVSRNPQISNQFSSGLGLTLSKTGTYTGRVTPARSSAVVVLVIVVRSRSRPRPLRAQQAQQRAIYVSVLNADTGAPVEGLGPSDFIIREDVFTREVLKVEPAEDPMQIAVLVDNSQAAERRRPADPDRTARLRRHDDRAARLRAARTRSRSSRSPTARRSSPTTRPTRPRSTRPWTASSRCPTAECCCSTASSRSARGCRSAAPNGPSSSPSRPRGASSARASTTRCSRRCTTRTPRSTRSSSDRRRPASGTGCATSGSCSTGARATAAAGATTCSPSIAVPKELASLADELQHQYLVTYARPESLIPPEQVTVGVNVPGSSHAARRFPKGSPERGPPPSREPLGRRGPRRRVGLRRRRTHAAAAAAARRRAGAAARGAPAGVPSGRRARLAERHGHRRRRTT